MIYTFLTCLGLLQSRSFLELYASIPEVCINIINCSKAQVQFKGFFFDIPYERLPILIHFFAVLQIRKLRPLDIAKFKTEHDM